MTRLTPLEAARGKALVTGSPRDRAELRRLERLDEYVKKVVDGCPPLTNEQKDRLAVLLSRGGAA